MKRRLLLCAVAGSAVAVVVAACSGGQKAGKATIIKLLPNNGSDQGGETVLVTGSGFGAGPASVLFDGIPATNVTVVNGDQISCVIPAHAMPGGVSVLPVKVTVRSSGRVGVQEQGFEYVASHEVEPPDGNGVNDTFANYELIPLDADFQGHIGSVSDVDILHLHPPGDGQVFISASFSASYTSGGLAGLQIRYFHGPDPTPNPEADLGGVINAIAAFPSPAPSIANWLRMAYLYDGHGPFLEVTGVGDGQHSGFDPVNPYTIHVHFVPNPTFEPAPQADDFFNAAQLPSGDTTNTASYDQDYDWFGFTAQKSGWFRITLNGQALGTTTAENEVELHATLFKGDPTNPDDLLSVPNAGMTVGDPGPGGTPFAGVLETVGLSSNFTYYLRLDNRSLVSDSSASFSYPIRVERGDGDVEAQEPSGLAPAETEFAANAVGSLSVGNTITKTGYFFHEADKDWFVVTAAAGTLTITLDATKIRGELGDYDVHTDPLGTTYGLMVFDSTWFADPAHTVDVASTVGGTGYEFSNAAVDPNKPKVSFTTAGDTYYILADDLAGLSLTSSYSISFSE